MRQRLFQQIKADEPREIMVLSLHVLRCRVGIQDVQRQTGMRLGKLAKVRLEGMILTVAHAIEQMRRAFRLLGKGGLQHRQDRRDANATCDEHRGGLGITHENELSRWRTHVQKRANVHLIVQPA